MNDESRGLWFLTGLLLGGIVGAAIALLWAPQSGEETREQLREEAIELQKRGSEMTAEARERANKMAAEAQERSRLALEEQKARLQEAIDAGKQAASQRKGELMNRFEADKAPQA